MTSDHCTCSPIENCPVYCTGDDQLFIVRSIIAISNTATRRQRSAQLSFRIYTASTASDTSKEDTLSTTDRQAICREKTHCRQSNMCYRLFTPLLFRHDKKQHSMNDSRLSVLGPIGCRMADCVVQALTPWRPLLPYGTAIKHPVPDRVKQSFVIFVILALWRWASECPDVKNYKWRLNPVWRKVFYSCCTHMATVGVKGLNVALFGSMHYLAGFCSYAYTHIHVARPIQ